MCLNGRLYSLFTISLLLPSGNVDLVSYYSRFTILAFQVLAQIITLSSNQTDNGACLGDVVVFTCTVTESPVLQWAVESLFEFGFILFSLSDVPGSKIQSPACDVCNITLLSVELSGTHRANLTSELAVIVTVDTIEKHIYCGNQQVSQENAPSIEIMKRCKFRYTNLHNHCSEN